MPHVTSPYILYVGNTAYDLRKISSVIPGNDTQHVIARFIDDPRVTVTFDTATFFPVWQTSLIASQGASPTGPAGGDLSGTYPNPTVAKIQGFPVSAAAPTSGSTFVWNGSFWQISYPVQYFASHALAVAAAPFINGTTIVISPGSPTSEAGTYQVTSNGGVTWPTDYTLVSSAVITASQVGITDSANWYAGATNVEQALAQIGAGQEGQLSGTLSVGANTLDSIPFATYGAAEWQLEVVKGGNTRYYSLVNAVNDGSAVANFTETGVAIVPGNGTFDFTVSVSISGPNMILVVTPVTTGWAYRVRRRVLNA